MTSKLAVIRAHVQPCEFYCQTVSCFTHPSAAAHLKVFKSHHQRSKFLWCLCVIRWWAGEWQKCSSSCGDMGLSKRTVLCIRSLGLDEQRALQPTECQHLPKPESIVPCNTRVSCPADWTTGSWSEVSIYQWQGTSLAVKIVSRLYVIMTFIKSTEWSVKKGFTETVCAALAFKPVLFSCNNPHRKIKRNKFV